MKRKRLPAEIFPEEPLESVGTWLAGPVFGPAGLSTVTLDRSGSEFWREYSAGRRAFLTSLSDTAHHYGYKVKISEPPLDSPVRLCYYITDAAQRGISMRIFICSSFIYPAVQTEIKRENGRTEEKRITKIGE